MNEHIYRKSAIANINVEIRDYKKILNGCFFKNKKVFITGHTGFKGSWLCYILKHFDANILGYSLQPESQTSLFNLLNLENDTQIHTIFGDVRDQASLQKVVCDFQPDIVIHMAAQPLVKVSYMYPVYTYQTNIMGTINVLEAVRRCDSVRSFLNVTTDKVYENKEWEWSYRENEPLDGYDPYSNSKSCSELVTHSYKKSFLKEQGIAVSTARAGNVIGGGDFSKDRIIPDCVRAAQKKTPIIVRNPQSIRPYQHVLEPLFAYLMIVEKQYEDPQYADYYNIGPNESDCITTGDLVRLFCKKWGDGMLWENCIVNDLHESKFLKLDCSKIKATFDWKSQWNVEQAIEKTIEWTKSYLLGSDICKLSQEQIKIYINLICC